VTFAIQRGHVTPDSTLTDASGVARATVSLGERAGPVTVTARAGRVSKQATLYALPGEPENLIVQRDGAPVSRLALATRDSVSLLVVTRDHFGNEAIRPNLSVRVVGGAGVARTRASPRATSSYPAAQRRASFPCSRPACRHGADPGDAAGRRARLDPGRPSGRGRVQLRLQVDPGCVGPSRVPR
jgi:hypothetical protein